MAAAADGQFVRDDARPAEVSARSPTEVQGRESGSNSAMPSAGRSDVARCRRGEHH